MCTIVVNASTWPLNESADSLSALVLIKSLIVSRKHGGRVDCQTVYVLSALLMIKSLTVSTTVQVLCIQAMSESYA